MQTFQELMTSALAEAGLNDDQVTTALTKIYSHDKLSPKLNALVKTATEDYNAQVGRVKQYQDWYPKAQAEYDRMAGEYNKAMEELNAFRSGHAAPNFDPTNYISREELARMLLQERAGAGERFASVIKDTASITARHVARFKEEPDINAIDKIAMEQNLPLAAAYDKYIEPRVKEQEKAANEQWKKDQREEIERDLRSRYQLPAEQVPAEQSPLLRKTAEPPKDMDAELMAAWRSVPAKP
jgi:hypothetical protein